MKCIRLDKRHKVFSNIECPYETQDNETCLICLREQKKQITRMHRHITYQINKIKKKETK